MISCSALCTNGISSVKNVVATTPISMMVLRLQWSDTADAAKPPMHSMKVGPTASQSDVRPGQMQRRFGKNQQRAGQHQIVALDKADEGKDGDYQHVVTAERDTVELAAQ